jgi:hypothetical protein
MVMGEALEVLFEAAMRAQRHAASIYGQGCIEVE